MIAAWMLFALEVGALMFVAAWLAERALRSTRLPVRGIWVGAMIVANVLPFVIWKLGNASSFAEKFSLRVAPTSVLAKLEVPLIALWGVAIAIGTAVCAAAVWRIARTRPLWKTQHVDNTPVLVSHDVGPALVGVMHYSIVVPEWAYSLEERARQLLLTHEREHARHYDPLLLAAAAFAVVLAPWNVFNWLFFRRLHLAVELDCDQRVLRAHPDTRGYSELLLDVAERVIPSVMPAAAFVEHGASLETRLNAMKNTKVSFQSLRVSTGVALALVVAVAACFTPRPYIIIVNPPAATGAPSSGTTAAAIAPATSETVPEVTSAEPAMSGAHRESRAAATRESGQPTHGEARRLSGNATTGMARAAQRNGEYAGPPEVWPVPPSARVKALDDAAVADMRSVVMREQRKMLGDWPRSDSALMLLFDSNNKLAKQITVARDRFIRGREAASVFAMNFMTPEVMNIQESVNMQIDRGLNGELLREPLSVYAGYLYPGADTPKTRAEITPSREKMAEVLRARHFELLADTIESENVGMLLYDSKGNLVKSAVVKGGKSMQSSNPSTNAEFEQQMRRMAFGTLMDSGMVVANGTYTLYSGKPLKQGPWKIMYAIQVKNSEMQESMTSLMTRNMDNGGGATAGSSSKTGRRLDTEAMKTKLLELVQTRVPDAFGDWARGDSAVLFVFNDEGELVARRMSRAVKSATMAPLAKLISNRVENLPADDLQTVGFQTFTSTPAGRRLDQPLVVVWGMLYRDSKWTPPVK